LATRPFEEVLERQGAKLVKSSDAA